MYSESGSSSSAPLADTASWTYDVFLSFKAKDTLKKFTGRLYSALGQKKIDAYIDLTIGEEISPAVLKAIEESRISIIVFSANYAASQWCLDELVHILECRRSKNQIVRPIFYKVDPSDVRHQRGKFGEALAEHERRFKGDMDEVLTWRAALSEAANLSGWLFSESDGYEYELIDKIVEEISAQVKEPTNLDMPKYQAGLDFQVQEMLEILDVEAGDIRMVGIFGIGGIGKTTIARAVYKTIAHKFDGSCFLANVRQGSEQYGGIVNLQNIILSKILGGKELKVINVFEGITLLRERLRYKRILLVLDDVDQLDQLDKLAGEPDWFHSGSRVIITTRGTHLLKAHQVDYMHYTRRLLYDEARELLSSNAFKNKRNLDDGKEHLISTILGYAQGLPLALVVLGSHLCGRPIHEWQAMLDGYRRNHPKDIRDILKVSYDGLEEIVKEVFLDIACFFKGWNTNDVIQILEGCDRNNPKHSIEVLEEKALINVGGCGRICMHDLLEEMGKYIVQQESTEPGERSRLWHHKDVQDVLTENTGTSKIEGIMLKMPTADEICLSHECFKKMKNLKIFINVNARFCGFDCLPNQLRLLDWPKYPLQSLPSNFNMKKLIQLSMPGSCISCLGEGFKSMKNLKSLNLKGCESLEQIPDLSGSPNLEFLDLSQCTNLVEIHPSVGSLKKPVELNLQECSKLVMLPEIAADMKSLNLRSWRNLTSMSFESCEFIKIIPDISGLPNLKNLNLNDCTSLVEFDDSVGELDNLVDLSLSGCHNLITFPRRITLKSVKHINFKGCQMLESLPEIVHEMECLTLLDLSGTTIKELPSSIRYLRSLEELVLKECENLANLPSNIYELQHLWCLDLQSCSKLVAFPEWSSESLQINLKISHNLWYLNFRGCKRLEEIPELPPKVEWINVADCLRLKRFAKLSNILLHKESEMIKCITMFNCQRLCDSLALEIAKNGNILLNEVTLCSLFLSCKQSEFDIVFPGSEVPKWFSGRKDLMESIDKCEFSFEIPPNFNLGNKGFAICAAAATVENINPEEKGIMQQCSFTATIDINANRIVTRSFYFEAKDIESAHVWLCYIPFVKFVSRQSPPFTCGVNLEHSSQGSMRCKSYGVHLVIPQDDDEDEDYDDDEDEDEDYDDDDDDDDGDGDENDEEDGDEGKDQHEESVSKN